MSKELRKFSSLEELNGFISEGKVLYSIASAGNIWFVEYGTNTPNINTSEVDEFEALIEKGIRLGYIEVRNVGDTKAIKVGSSRNLCSLAIGHSDAVKKQMIEYCNKYSRDYPSRRELEVYVELK